MSIDQATANSAEAESALAEPSTELDNPSNLDFEEPEEEQATQQTQETGTDSNRETDEAPESQEAEEPEAQTEQTDEEGKAKTETSAEPEDSITVSMPDGQKLELKELKSGYMRDRDYRHKTTEVANKRRDLETLSTRVAGVADAISGLLMRQVPPAPEQSLSLTDPLRFIQEKAAHEAAMEHVNAVVEQATSVKQVGSKLTQEQTTEHVAAEMSKLVEAVPQLKTPEGQTKFKEDIFSAGRENGFTESEINAVTDHRMLRTLHYAALGMKAEAAKAKAAQKVVNVPPVATQRRQQAPSAAKARQNQDAMKKLAETGSIHAAMAVDFD